MERVLTNLSWDIINDYLERELLIIQKHPTKNLWILNYSKTCQYERAWDIVTLSSRGLVVDSEGNIVSRCMKKFFNKEEYEAYDDLPNIPTDEGWEAYEKMDGSLMSIFYYDEWIVASRGSFISEQAIKGTELLTKYGTTELDKNNTYILECIYSQNRIVINYGKDEKLVLLTVINNNNGFEMSYDDMYNTYNKVFPIVNRYDGKRDFEYMKALNLENKEGFVVKFSSGFRMKIKFESYIKYHKIMFNTSSKDIWVCLRDNINLDEIIEDTPDEFFQWIKKWEKKINKTYKSTEEINLDIFNKIMENFKHENINPTKKDFALANLLIKEGESSIRFKMFENKPYDDIIWKLVEPCYEKMCYIEEGE